MHPLSMQDAHKFWSNAMQLAMEGKRIILGAINNNELLATVTLLVDLPPNQPHRAELAKMMTKPLHRGQGIARMLLLEAEKRALEANRWLITLDTAEDEGAAGFYEKQGYQKTGLIPDFALKPHGGLTGTIIYWKNLSAR